ncbi:MAG: UvrD-helicase domain-containing protein [Caldimonas sp.]
MPATLNPAQLDAVHHLAGPCLVLAGAGSGKTRVIVHKIARLLDTGLAPAQIAAITFTNKAAAEMRERARALIGGKAANKLAVSTFHSLGVRILREDGERVGLKPKFSILDSDDVLGVLKDAGGTTDIALARRWQWTIGGWKNRGLDSAGVEVEMSGGAALPAGMDAADALVAVRVMQRYEERLSAYQAVDFDDLIVLPAKLLAGDEEVRDRWRDRLRYVLVDEYQDTNGVQYELMKLLAGARGLFTAVGDDDQSIYGWRGATVENLKRLPADYPTLRVIALEQNYRSTTSILAAANAVISNNPKLYEKKLWSDLGAGEPVRVLECDDEAHEADRAVAHIRAMLVPVAQAAPAAAPAGDATDDPASATKIVTPYRDAAVLYRANHQAKVFEQALRKAGIPYKVSGGQSFFDRAEIRDLCAWLRLLVNTDDDPAFLRAATSPKRGIGHQTLASLGTFAGRWKTSLFEALFAETLGDALQRRAVESLHEFGRYVNDLRERAGETSGTDDARTFLLEWLKAIDYEQHIHDDADSPPLAASRWSNVIDFVDWIARRCGGTGSVATGDEVEAQTVLQVAQTISVIISLAERGDDQNVVTLSTLHAAKGLEWPHVVLVGINEGLLPFRGKESKDGETVTAEDEVVTAQRIEEERRLMYVGITRARSTLVVSTLKRRKRGREMVAGMPSRFIAEMKLGETQVVVDPREKLKALRAAAAERARLTGAATALASRSAA